MDYPESSPPPNPEPSQEFVSARARRRRAQRRAHFPTDEEGRAALFTHLARRAYPSYELFVLLNQPARSRSAMLWGAASAIALLALLPFLPEKFPNTIVPLAYSLTVGELVKRYQLSKEQIQQSEEHQFQSNWRVVRVSVVAFVLFLVLMVAWIIAFGYFGVIDLA